MNKITHELEQGSAAWHAFRAEHFGASEAAAMLGISKYQTRAELLRRKATGIEPEVSPQLQAVFDRGHATEIGGRALAERIIGHELFPVTMSEGKLSASCDGLTMLEDIAFEHKQYNAALADSVRAGKLPEEHQPQCQQVMMVTGADQLMFMVSDGTEDNHAWMWVYPDQEWRKTLLQGWTQFAIDLEAYEHTEAKPEPTAATIEALPALFVQVEGKVLATNLDAFKVAAQTFIDGIKTELVNDQDFADADKMVKFLKDGEERLALAKSQALSQTASIDELFRTVDAISEQMKAKRLALDKLVKYEKENRKNAIVTDAMHALTEHVAKLNQRIGGNWMPPMNGLRFADAIKGLKSLDSMRDKVSGALANEKIAANELADRIEMNAKAITVDGANYNYLAHDFCQICTKAPDDFAAIMAQRIATWKAAEAEKAEAAKKAEEARIATAVEAERKAGEARAAAAVEAERMAEAKRAADAAAADQWAKTSEATHGEPNATAIPQAPLASSPPNTAAQAVAAMHDANDEAVIDDFLRLLAMSGTEKKALRTNIVKWEKYRVAREIQVAA